MRKILICVALFSTSAIAQPVQNSVQQPSEYTLKVTPADTDLIAEGLQTQPFGKVVPLINKLREQIIQQQQALNKSPVPVENKIGEVKDNKGIITQDNKPVETPKE